MIQLPIKHWGTDLVLESFSKYHLWLPSVVPYYFWLYLGSTEPKQRTHRHNVWSIISHMASLTSLPSSLLPQAELLLLSLMERDTWKSSLFKASKPSRVLQDTSLSSHTHNTHWKHCADRCSFRLIYWWCSIRDILQVFPGDVGVSGSSGPWRGSA